MKTPFLAVTPVLFLLALLLAGGCQDTVRRQPDAERGRYLVEQVGLCIDCHSPRGPDGRFLTDQWLCGGPIPFAPAVPMPWAEAAPRINGLPTLSDEQAVHFLTTGELPLGRRPRAPMPPYRMTADDARDVVAYLRHPIQPVAETQ